jgi:succinate dehydrogenase/fumarate reductase cytochrome b subunit
MNRAGKLGRAQAISGLVFLVFAAAHFANTAAAAFSAELYDRFQARARALYQYPVIELGLLIALAVHVAAGVATMRASRGQPHATGADRLHRYAGRILGLAILGHVAVTRGPSLLADVHPGFAGIAYSIVRLPAVSYPYFALLIGCGILHAGYGAWKAVRALGGRAVIASPPRALMAALVAGIALAWLGILGLGGELYAIPDPGQGQFAGLVERYFPRSADAKPSSEARAESQPTDARTSQPLLPKSR